MDTIDIFLWEAGWGVIVDDRVCVGETLEARRGASGVLKDINNFVLLFSQWLYLCRIYGLKKNKIQ